MLVALWATSAQRRFELNTNISRLTCSKWQYWQFCYFAGNVNHGQHLTLTCWHANLMAIRSIAVETFHSKPQMSTSRWRWRKNHRITKVIIIHHLAPMHVCTNFCVNPSSTCWGISQDKRKLWSDGGARGKVRRSPKSLGFILSGPWIVLPIFLEIHPIVVEIF